MSRNPFARTFSLPVWWHRLFAASPRTQRRSPTHRLRLETLEDRLALSTLTVLDTSDAAADPGSLRYQVSHAAPGDTIQFSANLAGQTISLTGPLAVNQNLTIQGPAGGATLSGNKTFQALNAGSNGLLAISNLTFTNFDNAITNAGTLTLTNDAFVGNTGNIDGAAVSNSGNLTVTNSTFSNNANFSNGHGGAIDNTGMAHIYSSTFASNRCSFGAGIANAGTLVLNGCTLTANYSDTFGGGVYNSGTLLVNSSTFINNTAASGSGVYNASSTLSTVSATLGDCTFTTAFPGDQTLYNSARLTVLESTITGNFIGVGTATSGDTLLIDSIVDGNQIDVQGAVDPGSTNNLFGAISPSNLPSSNLTNVSNPGLAPLGYYGGPTETIALLPTSPAIGAASQVDAFLPTDERGVARPAVTHRDIGAFQTQNGGLVVTTPLDSVGPLALGQMSLRQAVTVADDSGAGVEAISFDPTVFATPTTIHLGAGLTLSGASTCLTGPAAGVTLDGGYQFTVLTVPSGATASLTGLTIAHGAGGVANAGALTVSNCTFTGNSATSGGAVFNSGVLTISASQFTSNYALLGGGAIDNANIATVSSSTFSGNSTSFFGSGGAVQNLGTFTGNGNTFTSNSASVGGGVSNLGSLQEWNDSFFWNSASAGGAVYNVAQALLFEGVLEYNSAQMGGAVYNQGTLTEDYSTLSANTAILGAGVYNSGMMLLYGNNIVGNYLQSGGNGGGVFNTGTAYLYANYIAYNWAANYQGFNNVYGAVSN